MEITEISGNQYNGLSHPLSTRHLLIHIILHLVFNGNKEKVSNKSMSYLLATWIIIMWNTVTNKHPKTSYWIFVVDIIHDVDREYDYDNIIMWKPCSHILTILPHLNDFRFMEILTESTSSRHNASHPHAEQEVANSVCKFPNVFWKINI